LAIGASIDVFTDTEATLADIGLAFLVLGTLSLACQNAVEDLTNLNFLAARGCSQGVRFFSETSCGFHPAIWVSDLRLAYREQLDSSTLARIHNWRPSAPFFIDMGSFRLPVLSQFVTSQLFTAYAIILSTAKAIWFLSPQHRSR
jgi:hypothetical protein